ncbi:LysE family translocator [Aquincola sp. S2]|uniref:LysE family translocator n=1 Tax=Pseudaquabacterium terrae TaxID=2732868 RepID=A0ABX2EJJ1_9BURK|nr:LysE family translocator [Aquabacterium terrae]NRF68773.1 LysE family translocator [Aquabacterium terrae]
MLLLDGIHDLPLFIAAGLLLNITPGADIALIAARSGAQGFRAGAAAALGVGAGCMLHAAAAALGLSALLAGSATAFDVIRWIGAAYLVWLGISMLRTKSTSGGDSAAVASVPPARFGRVFLQGFLTNALNPKVALFFLAFVPQFIAAGTPHKAQAFLVLGLIFNINGTLVNLGFAWGIAVLRARLAGGSGRCRWTLWLTRGVGALFVALGLRLGLAESPVR